MAEFDFKVKYKKGNINAQADGLSRLHTTGEAVSHHKNDDIPLLELDMLRVELGPNSNPNEVHFIDTELAVMDELFAAVDDPVRTNFSGERIGVEELLQAQLNGPFCTDTRRKLNRGGDGI